MTGKGAERASLQSPAVALTARGAGCCQSAVGMLSACLHSAVQRAGPLIQGTSKLAMALNGRPRARGC